ncbi:DUF6520 family protein [Sphingobacterium thalpophilum]|uniref:DUF6520 family protein n=1 Tax=Sphingobacterium thalpophilum TaxID=259 RepID=UPI0037DA2A39
MKTKKLNLALIAVLLGTGAVFATNNPLKQSQRYYFYNNQWNQTPPPPSEDLECNPDHTTKICSALFDSAPTTTSNDVSSNPSASSIVAGNYE